MVWCEYVVGLVFLRCCGYYCEFDGDCDQISCGGLKCCFELICDEILEGEDVWSEFEFGGYFDFYFVLFLRQQEYVNNDEGG